MVGGDCENMELISSPSNNIWPQQILDVNHQITTHNMDSSTTRKVAAGMDQKPISITIQEQQAASSVQQAVQKCPRCDSANTKFCYYNNYSLTQPRHFCKACKRYWTRGGTLRNVPVGGGCRRNKRLKRPSSNSSSSSFSSALNNHNGTSSLVLVPSSTTSNNLTSVNPLFYNPSDLNHLQFSGYDINLDLDHHGHHHQEHHLGGNNNLGLGFFSSGLVLNEDYRNGFASDSILSSYGGSSSSSSSMFGSSLSSTNSTTPTMSSIIANNYHMKTLSPFENMEINGDQSGVKVEGGQEQNRFGNHWTNSSVPSSQNHQIQQFGSSTDNPSMYWSNTNWPTADLTNLGSSVTSLI